MLEIIHRLYQSHHFWNPLISKRKTDGIHLIDFCILSLRSVDTLGGGTLQERDVANIVKSDVFNELLKSDIRPCEYIANVRIRPCFGILKKANFSKIRLVDAEI